MNCKFKEEFLITWESPYWSYNVWTAVLTGSRAITGSVCEEICGCFEGVRRVSTKLIIGQVVLSIQEKEQALISVEWTDDCSFNAVVAWILHLSCLLFWSLIHCLLLIYLHMSAHHQDSHSDNDRCSFHRYLCILHHHDTQTDWQCTRQCLE